MFPIPSGAGPLVRLQVVVARPGEETFTCGSVLLHAAAAGVTTAVTCATRGEGLDVRAAADPSADLGAARETDLRTAAALLGVRRVRVLGFPDPAPDRAALRDAVAADVADFRPDVLVTTGGEDPEDVLVREAALQVAAERGLPVYLVAPCGTDAPSAVVLDTHEHLDDRWRAIRAYAVSPFERLDPITRDCLVADRLIRVPAPAAEVAGR